MALLNIRDAELQDLRELITEAGQRLASAPNLPVVEKRLKVAYKAVVKLNWALKRIHGHDCMGSYYLDKLRSLGRKRQCSECGKLLVNGTGVVPPTRLFCSDEACNSEETYPDESPTEEKKDDR